jgi:HD-GYP domain-containing protein (c-di-GMP phosphodiesterase class II)
MHLSQEEELKKAQMELKQKALEKKAKLQTTPRKTTSFGLERSNSMQRIEANKYIVNNSPKSNFKSIGNENTSSNEDNTSSHENREEQRNTDTKFPSESSSIEVNVRIFIIFSFFWERRLVAQQWIDLPQCLIQRNQKWIMQINKMRD